jgi:murein DD-endopeptidase MepM/ murein hydrolase activator NlpD
MCRTDFRILTTLTALGSALALCGSALASTARVADVGPIGAALTAVEAGDALRGGTGPNEPVSSRESEVAAVTFSRASDLVGRPVYFSRTGGAGTAGLVSFSTRTLPASAVFSIALPSPRPAITTSGPFRFSGEMPSVMPVSARGMTSSFGLRQHPLLGTLRSHSGVDLAASQGSPIIATSDGLVGAAGWAGGYGLLVALDHGNGLQTRYAHMSRLNVVPGQRVGKGEVIGFVGSTGMSTGPHLHYEIRVNGRPVNPASHLHGR